MTERLEKVVPLSDSGRLVIPAEFRERFGLKGAGKVVLREVDGMLTINSIADDLRRVRQMVAGLETGSGRLLSEELIEERREEARRESGGEDERDERE